MKKKLLYLTSIMLFSSLSINAQTTTWDFGTSTSSVNDGASTSNDFWNGRFVSADLVEQKLGFVLNVVATSFGVPSGGSAVDFGDGYAPSNGFKTGGGSWTGSAAGGTPVALPTARFMYFTVDKACTVKVWFKGGSSSAPARSFFVSDGTNILATGTSAIVLNGSGTANTSAPTIFSATLAAAGKYYIYNDAGNTINKIEVTGANVTTPALATDSFQAESNVAVYASEGVINVSNVISATKVSVYSVLGSLVKSIGTSSDADLTIGSGLYIVTTQSAEGTSTTKVLVK